MAGEAFIKILVESLDNHLSTNEDIVHFVGYASGLSPHPFVEDFSSFTRSKKIFAFDGDDLNPCSFTMQMVAHAAKKLDNQQEISLIAFRNENAQDLFIQSWHNKEIRIDYSDLSKSTVRDGQESLPINRTLKLRLVPISSVDENNLDYYAWHGLTAMQATKANTVLSFGGGPVVRKQIELCSEHVSGPMNWYLYPQRRLKGGVQEELGLEPFSGSLVPDCRLIQIIFPAVLGTNPLKT